MRAMTSRILMVSLLLVMAGVGCGKRNHSSARSEPARTPGVVPTPGSGHHDEGPQPVAEIANHLMIHECVKCGRMYDSPGLCPEDGTELHPTKVNYYCSVDGEVGDRMGNCPRCGRPFTIEKAQILPEGIRVVQVR